MLYIRTPLTNLLRIFLLDGFKQIYIFTAIVQNFLVRYTIQSKN
uniref:Uncharacterized protein n=1 Tax=Lepeophtheirus salmonis TaxID=72036 RepID=A0A0K2U6M1_LEPSM